jgi:nucleoside-diphosphate-sugar epimerase
LTFDAASKVNVAVISPVLVYGLSPSIEHPFPLVTGEVFKAVSALGTGFTVSTGKNILSHVHVLDLARLYLLLLSSALKAQLSNSEADEDFWGPEAYYFAASGEISFAEFMREMVRVLKDYGIIENEEIKQIDVHQGAKASGATGEGHAADSWAMHIAIGFGIDMRCRSSRAGRLGWDPKEPGVVNTLEEVLSKFLKGRN